MAMNWRLQLLNGSSRRVLVCGGERHIIRLIQVNLERQKHVVFSASSPEAALELALEEIPDLMILDDFDSKEATSEFIQVVRSHQQLDVMEIHRLRDMTGIVKFPPDPPQWPGGGPWKFA